MFIPYRLLLITCCLLLFLFSSSLFSLVSWSSFPLSLHHVYSTFFDFDLHSIEQQIIATIRLPRVLISLLIGANLAVAGSLMQGLTRNPLASPTILGINSGAACLMALSSLEFGFLDILPNLAVAFIGSCLSGALVLLLSGYFSPRSNPTRLILSGIAVNALLVAITRASVILADEKAISVISWLSGSMSAMDWSHVTKLWPPSLIALFLAMYLARNLNLMALGHEVATGLGVNIARTRVFVCITVLILTATSVSIVGPIGFIGIIVPHIVRRIVGHNYLIVIPVSAVFGATLLTIADAYSRALNFPAETPVGVITALIGAPFFIFLTIRGR